MEFNTSKFNDCIIFNKWSGKNGIEEYIKFRTGCKPYSGSGINYRSNTKTCILKSVDNTYFYKDDLNDINNIKYTLFGHNGDQNEKEPKFNEPLLNKNKTEHIYLYRVFLQNNIKLYIWYGEYHIIEKKTLEHIGKDRNLRNIIVLTLKKIIQ